MTMNPTRWSSMAALPAGACCGAQMAWQSRLPVRNTTLSIARKTAATTKKNCSYQEDIRGPMNVTVSAEDSPFQPCVWGDFFITHTPPTLQMSNESMKEKAEHLKEDVRRMFEAGNDMSAAETITLVDTLERLGIDNHFLEEIEVALRRVYCQEQEFDNSKELHMVALRFRLLRQHGFWVSPDVFDKFRDGTGNFILALTSDPRGMLSLYNGAYMALPGENALDDAIKFTRYHLKAMKGRLKSPLVDQISRALDIPLPRYLRPLETMHYISEYEQEEAHNTTLLELSRLTYNINRLIHLKELQAFCLWWKELYENVKLTYARNRGVDIYFWGFAMLNGEENSRARIIFSKLLALALLMDDTFDVHATIDECKKFHQALERWDESAISNIPEYLHTLYMKILSTYTELEDALEPDEKYRLPYVRKEFVSLSKYYLEEAKWCHENYVPSFREQVVVSTVTIGASFSALAILMAAGHEATNKAFEWARDVPDFVHDLGEIGRFLNDIAAYKRGKRKMDVVSSLDCYMKEHCTTGDEAATALRVMADEAWKRMNRTCMEIDRELLPLVQFAVMNHARICEVLYCNGDDAFTYSGNHQSLIASLFLKHVPA